MESSKLAHLSSEQKRQLLAKLLKEKQIKSYPCSYGQQRLWFISAMQQTSSAYNISSVFDMQGSVDPILVEESFKSVVARHDALRTSFKQVGNEVKQQVHQQFEGLFEFIDLNCVNAQDEVLEREVSDLTRHEFDLTCAPLTKVKLIQLSDNRFRLALVIHHIISDGWSVNLIMQEFVAFYQALSRNEAAHVAPLAKQYPQLIEEQLAQPHQMDESLAYWLDVMADAPPLLELPTDFSRPPIQSSNGGSHHFSISEEVITPLRVLANQAQTTLHNSLLTAFYMLLNTYSGQQDIVVGVPVAGRYNRLQEQLVGFFVNNIALRNKVVGNESFLVHLHRVKESTLQGYRHQILPFDRLVEEVNPERSLAYTPLFQVMFVWQVTGSNTLSLPDIHVNEHHGHNDTAKFDLVLFISETSRGVEARIEYRSDLFKASTIERMGQHFVQLLHSIVDAPEQAVNTLPMLTETEKNT
ncbi:hypothetical protein J8L98_24045, partial [Pseudoalteromonas sp. MMG013]|uniref:condensation domain-containing protein n=1 Tax=Pseudoalteromonas sp. MMG013 TaxID=2822687 RepID=UPI001B37A3D0